MSEKKEEVKAEKKYEPKWLYHKSEGAKLFNSEEEEKAAGKGWEDSPEKLKMKMVVHAGKNGKEHVELVSEDLEKATDKVLAKELEKKGK